MTPPNIPNVMWHDDFCLMVIYNAVKDLKPELCVELGCCEGFTSYYIATALQENGKGHLEAYDRWVDHPTLSFYRARKSNCLKNLAGLPVVVKEQDAYEVHNNYDDGEVDFMYVDMDNDGDVYKLILLNWYKKLSPKAVVIFEGGCEKRDGVAWMKERPPMQPILQDKDLLALYNMVNVGSFPSITIAGKI